LAFSLGVVVLVAFSLVALFIVDPWIALVALVLFPSLALLNRAYTNRIASLVARVQVCLAEVAGVAHESFDGALAVKTLGIADAETERMRVAANDLRDARVAVGRVRAVFEPAIDTLPGLGIIVVALVGAVRIGAGTMDPGGLVAAASLFGLLAFPVRIVGFFLQELPRSVVATGRIDGVLAVPPGPQPGVGAAVPPGPVALRFDHVGFSWPDGSRVLDWVGQDDLVRTRSATHGSHFGVGAGRGGRRHRTRSGLVASGRGTGVPGVVPFRRPVAHQRGPHRRVEW
jgi:ABC-type multidrug transport system fused ATPase/permease subunit